MMQKPRKLCKGDTIGLIAPCIAMKPDYLTNTITTLTDLGFSVRCAGNLYSQTFEYAASISERVDDFHEMIADDNVKVILFGGGEVCNELLPYLDYPLIAAHPKIICSYSDSTTLLNAITSSCHMVTYYGASPRTFDGLNSYNYESFFSHLMQSGIAHHTPAVPWKILRKGKAEGVLSGGYLVNYAALQGLPWFSYEENTKYLLFIEDHETFSSPAVVAKWFANLEHRGVMERVSGLIFGHYSTAEFPLIDEILLRIGDRYQIPVVRCEDFGHGMYHAVIPIGIRAELDADAGQLLFSESSVI